MKLFFRIFSIFTPRELRHCAFLVVVMIVGAVLEAVGIGAILPLISLMGQPDFLDRHAEIAAYAAKLGITTHTELIIGPAHSALYLEESLSHLAAPPADQFFHFQPDSVFQGTDGELPCQAVSLSSESQHGNPPA